MCGAVLCRLSAVDGGMQSLMGDELVQQWHARAGRSAADQQVSPAQLPHMWN
jgi:hypothetical protein